MNESDTRRGPAVRWDPRLLNNVAAAPDLASAAELLGAAGIPVLPCVPGGKRPLTTHGFHEASADRRVIESWWRRHPEANIGVPTGTAGGVDVVDVDIHRSGSGFEAIQQARRAGLIDGWAWMVRTPSGGLHAYFLRTDDLPQRSWQLPSKHIDFRGDGGYIIVPPSRVRTRDGITHTYSTITVADHQPGPVDAAALRHFLSPPRPSIGPRAVPDIGPRPDKLAAWVSSRPEGARNGGLFWAACRMAEEGHDLEAATTVLGDAARTAGLPDHEATTTIRSAYRIATSPGSPGPPRPSNTGQAVSL
ncbi:MAG: bifunctional DNA primase/polymerase [Nocardioides sp.]|uniref:bifunctional DNA primase/polymerase n=1 Tax=Nocardioides sp. TaxID=35761 RepID=UPI0039E6963D